ncbi:dihydrodipicolinate synthetase [Devosia pacifica]|uniref:Dihydrodipicolinate synthetase n=1 Tax=Devosia pacifica TaxID=1335967 RepID=A0A918S2R9_9HYPH|nr:dihydrodipicolinate synthase family protein [Devosia pacifica]GHA18913.1 dihydrodipicolinate synthetase [Devosia pacifica]
MLIKDLPEKPLAALRQGGVIPAHPLALDADRKLDERRQRALSRYYLDAGSIGIAVGVHTTQFEIRDHGLFEPVLRLAAEEASRHESEPFMVAGAVGPTDQAVEEARLAKSLGYHAVLLSLAGRSDLNEDALIAHCRAVAEVMPVIGFYLQVSVGGQVLPFSFWRRFAEIENVIAIKMAPFHRYRTLDVIRAVIEAEADNRITLYTGNDDHIVADLLTPFTFKRNGTPVTVRIRGGLLGHWAVWTSKAVELLDDVHNRTQERTVGQWLELDARTTDANGVLFDVANDFRGCIAAIHEVLRRQGLLEGTWCLNPDETMGPGQMEELDRIYRDYPELNDDAFVRSNLERWLA